MLADLVVGKDFVRGFGEKETTCREGREVSFVLPSSLVCLRLTLPQRSTTAEMESQRTMCL